MIYDPYVIPPKTRAQFLVARARLMAKHFMMAKRTACSVPDFFFHLGYQQFTLPRMVRRLFARTELHRAWLSGYTGLWCCSIVEMR